MEKIKNLRDQFESLTSVNSFRKDVEDGRQGKC